MAAPRARNPAWSALLSPQVRLTGPRIDMLFVVALLPPLAQALYARGAALLPMLALAMAVSLGWTAVFGLARGRPIGIGWVAPAIALALMVPAGAPLWQVGLGLTFGVVVGVHLFGGYGWHFVNPVVVALAFLIFSFPEAGYGKASPVAWEGCIPGMLLLAAVGIVSWRILLAAAAALAAALVLLTGTVTGVPAALAGFAFVLVFIACEPVSAPATDGGRWVYGVTIGALSALGLASGKGQPEAFAFAVLLGGIFAPLFDQGAVRWLGRRRRRREAERDG